MRYIRRSSQRLIWAPHRAIMSDIGWKIVCLFLKISMYNDLVTSRGCSCITPVPQVLSRLWSEISSLQEEEEPPTPPHPSQCHHHTVPLCSVRYIKTWAGVLDAKCSVWWLSLYIGFTPRPVLLFWLMAVGKWWRWCGEGQVWCCSKG